MESATKATATIVGLYAGLLGAAHGTVELLRGGETPGTMIEAIGPPCEAEAVWHACLPAMSLFPTFILAGLATLVVGLAVAGLAVWGTSRSSGGYALMATSIALLLSGGGFIAPVTGLVAGFAATRIDSPHAWLHRRSTRTVRTLAGLWSPLLIVYVASIPLQWFLGTVANDQMITLAGPALLVELGLLVAVTVAAFAADVERLPLGVWSPLARPSR